MAKSGGLLRLMDLPPEMLTRILLCLDRAADVVHVARTCRTLCQLAEQGQVWLHLCTQRWGSEIPVQDWLQRADSAKALFRLLSAIGPLVGVWEAQNLAPRGGLLYATWGDFGVDVYRVIPDWLDGGLMCARLFEVRGRADGRTRMLLIETKDGEEVQVPGAVVWRDSTRNEFFLEKYSPVAALAPALHMRRSASAGAHRPAGAGAWAHQLAAAGSHALAGAGDGGFAAGRGSGSASGLGSAVAAVAGDPLPPGTGRGLLHQPAAPMPPTAAALIAATLSALPVAAVAEAIGSARAQERMEEGREGGRDEKGKGIAKEAEDEDDEDDEMFDDAEELEQLESDGEEEGVEERSRIGSVGLPTPGVGGLAVGGGGSNALRSRAMHLLAGMLGRQDRPAGAPAAAAAAAGITPGLSALVAGVSGDDGGIDRSPLQAVAPFTAPAQDAAAAAVTASATAAAAAAAAPSPPSPSGQDVCTTVGDAEDRPEVLLFLQQQQQLQQMQQQPMSAVEAAAWDAAAAAAVGLHSRPQQPQMEGEIGGLTPAAEKVLNNMEGVRVESVKGAMREDGGCSGASVHGRGGSDNRSNEAAVTRAAEQQGMAGLLTRLASRMTGRGSNGDGAAVAASSGDGRDNSSNGGGNCDGSSSCSGDDSSSNGNVGQAPPVETQRLPSYYRRVEVVEASPGSSSSSSAIGRTRSIRISGSSEPSGVVSSSNIGAVVRVEELQGLWSGVYGPHGPEILNVTCSGGEILAHKILGDPNVPCGEISFKATIASEKVAEVGTFWQHAAAMAAAIADDAAMPEDSRPPTFVRMFQGHGRIADHNFVDPQWVLGKLFIDSLGRIAFIWEDVNFLIRFKRLVLTDIVPRRDK